MAKFSRSTIILAGARVFCLGMLALLLTLPCDSGAGAITFAYSGFNKDSLLVRQKYWKLDTTTGCFKFHPPKASTSGLSLYHDTVPVIDPGFETVKSFNTTFIYRLHKDSKVPSTGSGMTFTMVADDTGGTPQKFMGFQQIPPSPKNYTAGAEFNDDSRTQHQQIWIDYSEANSRIDVYCANYRQVKPAKSTAESITGLDLSLLKKNMYIGFSTTEGIDRDNVPYVCAWSFSNEGSQAPPIVIAEDASPPLPGPLPPTPPPISISPPVSFWNFQCPLQSPPLPSPSPSPSPPPSPSPSPSPNGSPPPPINVRAAVVGGSVAVLVVLICLFSLRWCKVWRRPLRIFISHAGGRNGAGKNFPSWLHQAMTSHRWSRSKFHVKPFLDVENCPKGLPFAGKILKELERFDVGVVVITRDFFERHWPMTELIKFVEVQRMDREGRIRVLPLFYELELDELKQGLNQGTWENFWAEPSGDNHPLQLQECRDAVTWLCNQTGIQYGLHNRGQDRAYIDTILKEVDKILRDERSIAADLRWAMKKLNFWR